MRSIELAHETEQGPNIESSTPANTLSLMPGGVAQKRRIAQVLWTVLGIVCFGLGAVGAVLPVVPTTPFLLVAAFAFARSSKKLNRWFRSTKLYTSVLENYLKKRSMPLRAKLTLLAPITILLSISFVLMAHVPVGRVVVACILIAHFIYFGLIVKTDKG